MSESPLNLRADRVIRVARPSMTVAESNALRECIVDNQISAGERCALFEKRFANLHNRKYGVTCNSGTTAIELALRAMNIGAGSTVAMPTMTMVACPNATIHAGATPVFVDSIPETGNANFGDRQCDAYLPVHLYGVPCGIPANTERVIEDCSEAHFGSFRDGKPLGSKGKVGVWSFFANKIVTCFPAKTTILVKGEGRGTSRVRNIEDIKIGQLVLSYNVATSQKEYKRVIATQEHSTSQPLSVVTFSNGNQIKMTSEHPVFVVNKGWVAARDLVVGDKAIQYIYRGLRNVECRGKTYAEIFGDEVGAAKAAKHSQSLSHAHLEGKFATAKYKASRRTCHIRVKRSAYERRQRMPVSSELSRLKQHIIQKHKFSDPEHKAVQLEKMNASRNTPEYRDALSKGIRRVMETERYWVNYLAGLGAKKNRAEAKLEEIINEAVPGEFVFNGDGSQGVRIGRRIPDFVHTGNKKKLIELFGEYWHKESDIAVKRDFYAGMGYECLFIWDTELKSPDTVKAKVQQFAFNPNIKLVEVVSVEEEAFCGKVYNITVEDNHNYFTKGILVHNCGEGGLIATDDDEIEQRLRSLRAHAFTPGDHFHHTELAMGCRMTELQAAIGLAQLDRKDWILSQREQVACWYREMLDCWWLETMMRPPGSVWWVYPVLIRKGSAYNKEEVRRYLHEHGVETRSFFKPMHQQPHLKEFAKGKYPVADDLYERGFYLPLFTDMTIVDVEYICDLLGEL